MGPIGRLATKFGPGRTGVGCSRRLARRRARALFALLLSWDLLNHCYLSGTVVWHCTECQAPGGEGTDLGRVSQPGGHEAWVAFWGIFGSGKAVLMQASDVLSVIQ